MFIPLFISSTKEVQKVIYANLYVHSWIVSDGYANLRLVQRSQKMFITLEWIWIHCVVKLTLFVRLALYKKVFLDENESVSTWVCCSPDHNNHQIQPNTSIRRVSIKRRVVFHVLLAFEYTIMWSKVKNWVLVNLSDHVKKKDTYPFCIILKKHGSNLIGFWN